MNDNKNIMSEEIRMRLESDSWNFSIAHKVSEARDTTKNNIWSFASLATAAMSFMIFMASIYSVAFNNSAYSGTGSIYSYAYIKNSINLDNDIIAAKVELTINEAFPMR
ncbi:MAG TPA: hypothetical protein PKG60_00415 [Spirochaetota bacterium]|nr:hypothetical protein [Spirochaetota bacterium]HPS85517.1 hypothetical protein [Spirochaetota bacterium]